MARVDEVRARLSDDLGRLAEQHEVPGVSAAILVGDDVVEGTFGVVNRRTDVPVTRDALFMIQSITKVLTATLVMQLVDESLVGLDDTVRTVLPDFRTADAGISGRITVRHLLTHTGGFDGDVWAATTSGPDALQRLVDDLVPTLPQNTEPGKQFSYCNAGFGVLGRLVEVLRGLPYADAVRRHLTEPLGIDELAFSADEALAFRTSIGHVGPDSLGPQRPLRNWAVMPPSNPAAGNQLAMSARGLLAVARMHLADGRAPDGTRVLSASSVRRMREPQVDHPAALGGPSAHGLGWWLERGGLVEHGGGTTGVSAMLRTSPANGLAAVVLTNSESGGALIGELLEPWFDNLAGVTPSTALPTPPASERVADVRPYVGRYTNRQHRFEIERDVDGRLWLVDEPAGDSGEMAARAGIVTATQRREVRHVSGDTFVLIEGDVGVGPVEFLEQDQNGRARLLFTGGRAAPRAD
jgi:CubicO group peptidase (beta-lactamase class C family)